MYTGLSKLVSQLHDLIFENLALSVPRQPSLGSYIRFLLSRPDQSPGTDGVAGGRSPGKSSRCGKKGEVEVTIICQLHCKQSMQILSRYINIHP